MTAANSNKQSFRIALGGMASALCLTLVGFLAGILQERMFAEGWILPVIVLAIGSFAAELLYAIFQLILGVQASFFLVLGTKVLPTVLYTVLVAVIIFPFLSRLLREKQTMTVFKHILRNQ